MPRVGRNDLAALVADDSPAMRTYLPADQIPDSLARWSSRVKVATPIRSGGAESPAGPSPRPAAGLAQERP